MSRFNNLENHFKEKREKNLLLVKKSIEELKSIDSEINIANVAKMTDFIAPKIGLEKGLTKGALYKNTIYKDLINKEQLKQKKSKGETVSNPLKLSEGDLAISLFELRGKNRKLLDENKILKNTLKSCKTGLYGESDLKDDEDEIKSIETLKRIILTLYKTKLLIFDKKTLDLRLALHGDLLIDYKSAIDLLGEDFIDDIRLQKGSHVC